jgi:hypothetical protein
MTDIKRKQILNLSTLQIRFEVSQLMLKKIKKQTDYPSKKITLYFPQKPDK